MNPIDPSIGNGLNAVWASGNIALTVSMLMNIGQAVLIVFLVKQLVQGYNVLASVRESIAALLERLNNHDSTH